MVWRKNRNEIEEEDKLQGIVIVVTAEEREGRRGSLCKWYVVTNEYGVEQWR